VAADDLVLPGCNVDDDTPDRPKPAKCAAASDAMDLEVPYCIHVTPDTFRLLEVLLRGLLGAIKSGGALLPSDTVMLLVDAVLDVIRANFIRLEHAHVDPVDVGLVVVGNDQTLAGLHHLLLEVRVLTSARPWMRAIHLVVWIGSRSWYRPMYRTVCNARRRVLCSLGLKRCFPCPKPVLTLLVASSQNKTLLGCPRLKRCCCSPV
jgi:hypothetical protein